MIIEAFAKINWTLDITGLREDGYHLMDMLMQPVSLADEITLEPAGQLSITTGGFPPSKADESNLAFRAARAFLQETGVSGGASIHLFKRIPIGAGMGGGSADAAAVIFGMNRLFGTKLTEKDLEAIGLALGADVPFCLRGGLVRTRGIGEVLEDHECPLNFWLVVIQPCAGLSTAQVFRTFHDRPLSSRPDNDLALHGLETGNVSELCAGMGNVLQPVAEQFRKEIGEACRQLERLGAVRASMTGSGSAVFGIFRSSALARRAWEQLHSREKKCYLCHTQHDSLRIMQE